MKKYAKLLDRIDELWRPLFKSHAAMMRAAELPRDRLKGTERGFAPKAETLDALARVLHVDRQELYALAYMVKDSPGLSAQSPNIDPEKTLRDPIRRYCLLEAKAIARDSKNISDENKPSFQDDIFKIIKDVALELQEQDAPTDLVLHRLASWINEYFNKTSKAS